MRRSMLLIPVAVLSLLAMGSSCGGGNDCSDKRGDEAMSASVSYKPTCKPEPKGPAWVPASVSPSRGTR